MDIILCFEQFCSARPYRRLLDVNGSSQLSLLHVLHLLNFENTTTMCEREAQQKRNKLLQLSISRQTEAYFEDEIAKVTKNSHFFGSSRDDQEQDAALFDRCEVQSGELLGQGSFADVYQVKGFRPMYQETTDPVGEEARSLLQSNVLGEDGKSSRYVIKHITKKLAANRTRFNHAAADLMIEAKFLSRLDHPNIIRIRGWARGETSSFGDGSYDGFFLLLDRVDSTLSQKLDRWREKRPTGLLPNMTIFQHYGEKLKYALQIADALSYMHTNRIIYRDMKPENVGILQDNIIKLFDFGMCCELPKPDNTDGEELFLMTMVGTRRYMAPEVVMRRGYNLKADVYSWAVVFYEMISLNRPFEECTRDLHQQLVLEEGLRPTLESNWPTEIQELLQQGWSQDPCDRPDMKTVCHKLEQLFVLVADMQMTNLSSKEEDFIKQSNSSTSKFTCCSTQQSSSFSCWGSTDVSLLHFFGIQ
jgi:serine/threonine protein kinase